MRGIKLLKAKGRKAKKWFNLDHQTFLDEKKEHWIIHYELKQL